MGVQIGVPILDETLAGQSIVVALLVVFLTPDALRVLHASFHHLSQLQEEQNKMKEKKEKKKKKKKKKKKNRKKKKLPFRPFHHVLPWAEAETLRLQALSHVYPILGQIVRQSHGDVVEGAHH